MKDAQAAMFGDGEQVTLPGMAGAGTRLKGPRPLIRPESPAQIPLLAPVKDQLPDWPMRPFQPALDQLSLEYNQMALSDHEPQPAQLALFPEPPPWEGGYEPVRRRGKGGRLSRKRSRLGITPGQRSLF